MVEITLFTDSVKCGCCRGIDTYNGLKGGPGNWQCCHCQRIPDRLPQPVRKFIGRAWRVARALIRL